MARRELRALPIRRDYTVVPVLVLKAKQSGTAVDTIASTTIPLLHNGAGAGRILQLRLIDPAF